MSAAPRRSLRSKVSSQAQEPEKVNCSNCGKQVAQSGIYKHLKSCTSLVQSSKGKKTATSSTAACKGPKNGCKLNLTTWESEQSKLAKSADVLPADSEPSVIDNSEGQPEKEETETLISPSSPAVRPEVEPKDESTEPLVTPNGGVSSHSNGISSPAEPGLKFEKKDKPIKVPIRLNGLTKTKLTKPVPPVDALDSPRDLPRVKTSEVLSTDMRPVWPRGTNMEIGYDAGGPQNPGNQQQHEPLNYTYQALGTSNEPAIAPLSFQYVNPATAAAAPASVAPVTPNIHFNQSALRPVPPLLPAAAGSHQPSVIVQNPKVVSIFASSISQEPILVVDASSALTQQAPPEVVVAHPVIKLGSSSSKPAPAIENRDRPGFHRLPVRALPERTRGVVRKPAPVKPIPYDPK